MAKNERLYGLLATSSRDIRKLHEILKGFKKNQWKKLKIFGRKSILKFEKFSKIFENLEIFGEIFNWNPTFFDFSGIFPQLMHGAVGLLCGAIVLTKWGGKLAKHQVDLRVGNRDASQFFYRSGFAIYRAAQKVCGHLPREINGFV